MLVICNCTHKCKVPKDKCEHSKPHDSMRFGCDKFVGGASFVCSRGGFLIRCVEVIDGKYFIEEIDTCKHCNGKGGKFVRRWCICEE